MHHNLHTREVSVSGGKLYLRKNWAVSVERKVNERGYGYG